MHDLVARGDRGGDAALDAAEIRSLATPSQQFATARSGGSYGFGDTGVLSSRTHIENTIDDLGLAPGVNTEAKRIASAFVDEFEGAAFANLRNAVAPILTEAQLADFDADLKRGAGVRTIQLTAANGSPTQTFVIRADPGMVFRHHLSADQMKVAAAAVEFDDARRSALAGQLRAVLTDEERDNFRAALARRPLVKAPGVVGGVVGGIAGRAEILNRQLRNVAEIVTTPRP
jgi:hypothetical protein